MKEALFSKIKIVISGAAVTTPCHPEIHKLAYEIGKELALHKVIVLTGATTGTPLWAAKGAYENGGIVIGLSPARSYKEHTKVYKLPIDYHHAIFYTGEGYSGRNLLLTKMGDGVIFICGRIGTLNEFTIAFEEEKPMGVLVGSGGTEEYFMEIVEKAKRGPGKIVWERDPKILVEKLINLVENEIEKE
ncbi:MAG: hypothetical protein C4278_01855 [Patescibacteria group bacterium]